MASGTSGQNVITAVIAELEERCMKIGIVSDIHGYIELLKLAMSLFETQGVSHIICAGDLVDGGMDDEAVIDYIRHHNIISVKGNHDREAFSGQIDQLSVEDDIDNDFGDVLNLYRTQCVNSLPMTHQFNWETQKVYLTHASPWSDTYHVFPNVSIDICRRIFDIAHADIVILGHTHIPMKLCFDYKWIFNSGAISGNRSNLQRTCGILTLPHVEFELFDVDTGLAVELDTTIVQ
jgi:putative phosphoesterase